MGVVARQQQQRRRPSDHDCSIEGCNRAVEARGWCKYHYGRWRKYGTTARSEQAAPPTPLTDEQRRLVEAQVPLVRHIVYQTAVHFPRHVDRQELACVGALGLVEAAGRYDPTVGPFEHFAAARIRSAILDAVRAVDWAPRSVRTLARKLEAVEQKLATELHRSPSSGEIADFLGMTLAELSRYQASVLRSAVLSLDHETEGVVGGRSDGKAEVTLIETIADGIDTTDRYDRAELIAYLHDAVRLLPDRHRDIIVAWFFDGRTQVDIAADYGVTDARVSQLITAALVLLRHGIAAQYDHLDPPPPPANVGSGVGVARRRARYAAAIAAAHRKAAA